MLAFAAVLLPVGAASAAPQRQLFIFAANAATPALAEQRRLLAERNTELAERDLTVIQIVGSRLAGAPGNAMQLRRRYHVTASQFRVLLIGKDGGVKLDRTEPVDTVELFATIDAMPMRKDEMRR